MIRVSVKSSLDQLFAINTYFAHNKILLYHSAEEAYSKYLVLTIKLAKNRCNLAEE